MQSRSSRPSRPPSQGQEGSAIGFTFVVICKVLILKLLRKELYHSDAKSVENNKRVLLHKKISTQKT